MKLKEKRIAALLLSMIFVFFMGTTALAAEVPDLNKKCSVTFTMLYGGKTLVGGGSLTLYRVGKVYENNGDHSFIPAGDFAACGESYDNLEDKALADRLEKFAKEHSLKGIKKDIDGKGKVTFEDLEVGLYLVVQQKAASGYEEISPFLLSLPTYDKDTKTYQYDLTAEPKTELVPKDTPGSTAEPEPTPETETVPPSVPVAKLPQTGQLWWPVPILLCGGLVLIAVGFVFIRRMKSNEN